MALASKLVKLVEISSFHSPKEVTRQRVDYACTQLKFNPQGDLSYFS